MIHAWIRLHVINTSLVIRPFSSVKFLMPLFLYCCEQSCYRSGTFAHSFFLVGVRWHFSGVFISVMNDGAEHVYLHISCIWWPFGYLWWHIKTFLHFSALLKLIIEHIYFKCPTRLVLYPCDKSMWRIFTLERALFPASFLFQAATLLPPVKVGPICYWWLSIDSTVKNECLLVHMYYIACASSVLLFTAEWYPGCGYTSDY